ncbi:MAG: NAD(P)H-hydrate dehydratase [Phycisphaerae bacterium]
MADTKLPPPQLVTDIPKLPSRACSAHKGTCGRIAIIAGSRGMSGAAILTALGALRGGAGLVRVLTAESAQPIVAAAEPCVMTVPLGEDGNGRIAADALTEVQPTLTWCDVTAIGPGLGEAPALGRFVADLAEAFNGPMVLDADALNNLSREREPWWEQRTGRVTVVTPHPGEVQRMRDALSLRRQRGESDDERLASAHELASVTGAIVVFKGHHTVVADGTRAYINQTGNPGMATGGMGDVLTGVIAALLGQHMPAFDAARLAVYAHGLAADRLAESIAPIGFLARDVADAIPAALFESSKVPVGFR